MDYYCNVLAVYICTVLVLGVLHYSGCGGGDSTSTTDTITIATGLLYAVPRATRNTRIDLSITITTITANT